MTKPTNGHVRPVSSRLRLTWASAESDRSLLCPHELSLERTAKPLIRLGNLSLRWAQRSFKLLVLSWGGSFYFVSLASTILISAISRRFISWNSPRKRGFFMYPRTCMSPFIMSYCRRVVILTFIFHDGLRVFHCSYSPRGDVRVVSLMVNGYADIYKDNTRKHLRTHTMSNRRSIITTGLKLFRISMLSTEPHCPQWLSNRRLRHSNLRPITANVTIGILFSVDWHDSYTWLSTVCLANTFKDFIRPYEYTGWSESSLDLLVIL